MIITFLTQPIKTMLTEKNIIKLAGVLLIFQLFTAIISYSVILEPILYSQNFLEEIVSNTTRVRIAAILDFVTTLAYFGFAIILYPILRRYSERIALWYAGIKLSEFVTLTLSGILLLTILSTGQMYVAAQPEEVSYLESFAKIIRSARVHTQNLNLLAYGFGTYLFYYLLFITRLVPRFISLWGFFAVTGMLSEIMLSLFDRSSGTLVYILGMPLGLLEIFLGFWLIIKGLKIPESNN